MATEDDKPPKPGPGPKPMPGDDDPPAPTPAPAPAPIPDDDPPLGVAIFRRWLTDDERATLSPPERRALRQSRKWPNGRPPWLARTEKAAVAFAWDVLFLLVEAAKRAVLLAAANVATGGQLRHEFAVATLMAAAVSASIDLATEDAGGLIEEAFDVLTDEGAL